MSNNIDSVKMVREIREKQYEEVKNMSNEEKRRYYAQKASWAFKGLQKGSKEEVQERR